MESIKSNLKTTLAELKAILDKVKDPCVDDWDPIHVGLLLSKLEYDDLDVDFYRNLFIEIADKLARKISRKHHVKDQVLEVSRVFSGDLDFKGDQGNYYNIKNSFLSDILVRRKGIPVSLSLVYMGFCRHVGIKAVGINFPGHFLVEVVPDKDSLCAVGSSEIAEDWTEKWYVDCFKSGDIITNNECEKRLQSWTRGMIDFGPEVLKVAHPVEIISRMLRNLKAIFVEKEDLPRLYWVLSALIELCPNDSLDAYRERGLLMGRMGRYNLATADLKHYLEHSEDALRSVYVESMLRIFENRSDEMN